MGTKNNNYTTVSLDHTQGTHPPLLSEVKLTNEAVPMAYVCICVIGIAANVILLASLFTGRKSAVTLRTPSMILIINLAIADVLLLLTLPFAITARLERRWIFGHLACKLEEGVKFLGYYGSIFFITTMAIDRYMSLRHTVAYSRRATIKAAWVVCIALWILAILCVTPLLVFVGVDEYEYCYVMFPGSEAMLNLTTEENYADWSLYSSEDYGILHYFPDENAAMSSKNESLSSEELVDSLFGHLEDSSVPCLHPPVFGMHVWLVCNFIIGFVIPFIIISVSYAKIMMLKPRICKETCKKETSDPEQLKRLESPARSKRIFTHNQRAKVILGLLVPCLIIAFAICWLPYHVWQLAKITGIPGIDLDACNTIRDITFCFGFCNSAMNPILNSLFLFNLKDRLRRSSTWLKKVSLRGQARPRKRAIIYNASRDANFESHSRCEVTIVVNCVSREGINLLGNEKKN